MNEYLLEVNNLKTYFKTDDGIIKAVDDISFSLETNKILGIVGESGCGKSVTALSILNLLPGSAFIENGQILFKLRNNKIINILNLKNKSKQLQKIRGGEIAMIFQDPMTFLNPVYSIGFQIYENIYYHVTKNSIKAKNIVLSMLNKVGIPNYKENSRHFPHEFSGGMRQRSMIAMALSGNPRLLIADEPTTALDVTIQAQVLELIKKLKYQYKMSVILITHDLGVVSNMADEVIVMYMGKIVESAPKRDLFTNPKHPYTIKLLESIPVLGKGTNQKLIPIKGTTPDPLNLSEGCLFSPRCTKYMKICENKPSLKIINKTHKVSCWLYGENE